MTRKTVLITGATSDIGREIALRFAQEGWDVLCHYFSLEEKAQALKQTLEKHNTACHLFQADFSSESCLTHFLDTIEKKDIDSLINNAGTYVISKQFSEVTLEEIKKTFMINSFAPILLSSRIFRQMEEKKFGRIVNISSIAAKYGGSSNSLHYGCSKLALEGITKTLAREGAKNNILVNSIRPGVIDTSFHKKFPKELQKRIELIPLKKMGRAQDVAEIAYYLGSEKNNFITNEIITIAGGE